MNLSVKNNKLNKKVLVTGANSLLGTNTILELLSRGYEVRGMLRSKKSWKAPLHPQLELFEGLINKPDDVEQALESCHHMVHTAAITNQNLLKLSDYEDININSVSYLAETSIRMNIESMILVGSANAYGHGSKSNPGNENSAPVKPFTKSLYAQSKIEAAKIISDAAEKNTATRFITINPGFMLGPWDSKPSSGKIILMYKKSRLILCPPGGKSFVHVKDVATAARLAIEKGNNGDSWLITGNHLTYKEFFEKLNTMTGQRKPVVKIPCFLLVFAGITGDLIRALGIKTSVSSANMRILCENPFYTNQKIINDLGVTLTTSEQTIRDALEWFENK